MYVIYLNGDTLPGWVRDSVQVTPRKSEAKRFADETEAKSFWRNSRFRRTAGAIEKAGS